ncbi:MAG: hypothetical protein DMG57_05695 [Acidobacteria bacterium]|nr:MAG: hypothetical protein DMG57_05695 [Acidobacteriota bacterium]
MADSQVLEKMRADWNARAKEDVRYYVAFGRRGQTEEEFFATAGGIVRQLEEELARFPKHISAEALRGLEIGCGPGRLMRTMSRNFGELHGVDVSDEMVQLALEKFRGATKIHVHRTNGADLDPLASDYFDFVYSYAVLQHIPAREVVYGYFSEIRRVLKTGGILKCQLNGLPASQKSPDTWEGVRFARPEIADYARDHDFQLLALEGAGTQYMWTTWRKQPHGWSAGLTSEGASTRIRGLGNAQTGEPVVPASGRYAYLTLWMEQLPSDCDLNHLQVAVEGRAATVCYVGPPAWDGLSQINVLMPPGVRTGLLSVEAFWLEKPMCPKAWLHVIPAGPLVPRVCSVLDGTNLLAGNRIESGTVKLVLEDLPESPSITASIDGTALADVDVFCTDALVGRYEVNVTLPEGVPRGAHMIELLCGSRRLAPTQIEVV